jgi:hypothetical protein
MKKMGLFIPKRVFSVEQPDKIRESAKRKLGDKVNFQAKFPNKFKVFLC